MGLDPQMESEGQIPTFLKEEYSDSNKIILEFNKAIIEENHDDFLASNFTFLS